jgi:hypothetical protein
MFPLETFQINLFYKLQVMKDHVKNKHEGS